MTQPSQGQPPMVMHVVAGVLQDASGRVLLAQRPEGKHLAGYWEFSGGKLEPGEAARDGLQRELQEELAIHITQAQPWLGLPWCYDARQLWLDVWKVTEWQGQPCGHEGQAIRWQLPTEVRLSELAPADRMIMRSLSLPAHYVLTSPELAANETAQVGAQVLHWLATGETLIQLRLPRWSATEVRALAAQLLPVVRQAGGCLLLNDDIEGARQLGAGAGVHLPEATLLACHRRPLADTQRVGASTHSAAALAHSSALDLDFAVFSPVLATASHPGQPGQGWDVFAAQLQRRSVPVYGMGGLTPADTARAQRLGAQGVAGIRGFNHR